MLSLSPSRSISEPPPNLAQEAPEKKWARTIRGHDGGMEEGSNIQISSARTERGCRKTHAMSLMKSNLVVHMGIYYDTGIRNSLMKDEDGKKGEGMTMRSVQDGTMGLT